MLRSAKKVGLKSYSDLPDNYTFGKSKENSECDMVGTLAHSY